MGLFVFLVDIFINLNKWKFNKRSRKRKSDKSNQFSYSHMTHVVQHNFPYIHVGQLFDGRNIYDLNFILRQLLIARYFFTSSLTRIIVWSFHQYTLIAGNKCCFKIEVFFQEWNTNTYTTNKEIYKKNYITHNRKMKYTINCSLCTWMIYNLIWT